MRFLRAPVMLIFAFMLVTLAGCAGQAARPGAAAPPSSTPSAAATPGPATAPAPGPSSGVPASSPSTRVLSSRVAYGWLWPNGPVPGRVTHSYPVPPVPELMSISVGEHPAGSGQPAFDRMAFTFTNAFPSYRFERGTHLRHRRRPPDPAFESAICCPRLRGRNDHRERPAPLRGRDRYRRQAPVAEGCGSAVVLAATGALTLWAT